MRPIVGVMPMAGTGSRLGLPFHKSLLPTFMPDGTMVPLWRHAYDRLSLITDEIVCILSPEGARDPCMQGVPRPVLVKEERGESPSSIALAARHYPDTWIAMVFPDTIWQPENAMVWAAEALEDDIDGVLLDFFAPGNVLDRVFTTDGFVSSIVQKQKHLTEPSEGWGAFIIRSDLAAEWRDGRFISDNLQDAKRLRTVLVQGQYDDLGTPEQYRRALCR